MRFFKKVIFFSALIALFSCEKQPQEVFLKSGEIVYVGKPENLVSLSGKNRIKLVWDLVSDPKISKAKVVWNNPSFGENEKPEDRKPGKDSLVFDIQRTDGRQTIEYIIDNLKEGVYTFSVYTFDKDGNSSIKTDVIGESYGEIYLANLSNRPLNKASFVSTNNTLKILWFGAGQQTYVVETVYIDIEGNEKTHRDYKVFPVPGRAGVFLEETSIVNFKKGTSFKYRTGFIPTENSIDVFYTPYTIIGPIN